jgi:hypothetical protein
MERTGWLNLTDAFLTYCSNGGLADSLTAVKVFEKSGIKGCIIYCSAEDQGLHSIHTLSHSRDHQHLLAQRLDGQGEISPNENRRDR